MITSAFFLEQPGIAVSSSTVASSKNCRKFCVSDLLLLPKSWQWKNVDVKVVIFINDKSYDKMFVDGENNDKIFIDGENYDKIFVDGENYDKMFVDGEILLLWHLCYSIIFISFFYYFYQLFLQVVSCSLDRNSKTVPACHNYKQTTTTNNKTSTAELLSKLLSATNLKTFLSHHRCSYSCWQQLSYPQSPLLVCC